MERHMLLIISMAGLLLVSGCASKLPETARVENGYSSMGIKSYALNLDCSQAEVTGLQPNFAETYCQVLEGNLKLAIARENPEWTFNKDNHDLLINAKLEQIHGGSAAARFWIGFGAGRSVTTIFVKLSQNGQSVAERRFNETTTMPNIVSNNWTNEDAITQDAPLVAKQIAAFINNPVEYNQRLSQNRP